MCPSSAFCLMSSGSDGVELHSSALDGMCRVRGRLLSTQRATYPCKDLGNNLERTFTTVLLWSVVQGQSHLATHAHLIGHVL